MSISFDGITPDNYPTNARKVLDANWIKTRTLPATATTLYSASLDLGDALSKVPYATTETVNVHVLAPAITHGIMGSETITYTIQDSVDDSSFTSTTLAKAYTGSGAGAAAATITFKLQPEGRRYIRLAVTSSGSTTGADALTATLQLAF